SRDEAEELADHIEIKTRLNGTAVEVQTNYLGITSRGRSFWQKVFGKGEDAPGEVAYKVSVPVRSDVTVQGLAATITLASIEGAVRVENESGATRAEYIFGPVTVSQPQGDIDLLWIEGDIRVKATTGTVTVNQVRGALDIATHTGEVHVRTELDSPRDFFVATTSGKITFAIPPAASGRFLVETASGGIQSQVPLVIESVTRQQLIGSFGRGGPRINLTTSSGDVTVAQY
ncbi:MAG TPA: DUF4097 family beta strand repeat-containing protein, partial [candidate division Zixibacteria bacterium]|nr:DUF4097 family beta strand repeat-containing protein [candidate division Zixibacteria bacterium]